MQSGGSTLVSQIPSELDLKKTKILDILVSGGDLKPRAQNILEAIQYSTRNWTKNVLKLFEF